MLLQPGQTCHNIHEQRQLLAYHLFLGQTKAPHLDPLSLLSCPVVSM